MCIRDRPSTALKSSLGLSRALPGMIKVIPGPRWECEYFSKWALRYRSPCRYIKTAGACPQEN
eukprot:4794990-Alexandrium_andersonii.AAC.1